MAKQVIFLGTVSNDGTGTPLRDAMDMVNDNFTEVYDDIADIKNGITFTGDIIVPDEAYGIGWDSSLEVPTKNAVYDAIEGILDGCTFTGDIIVPAEAYGAGWNGSNEAPTKNDVYNKIEDILDGCTFTGDIIVPDEAYGVGWNGSLEVPTKNAVYDQIQLLTSATALPPNYQDIQVTYLTTSTVRIDAGGRVRSADDTVNIVFSSNYTIDMTDSTPDSTQGGRSVSESASTSYYVYVGLDGSNNPIAWLDTADLSAGGSPTNPASYSSGRTQLRVPNIFNEQLIVYNNSSSDIDYIGGSQIWLTGGNGHGSTNTRIRRFTTIVRNIGMAVTLTQSSTLGDIFTINKGGLYSIEYQDGRSGNNAKHGISLNSNQLTTDIESITNEHRLGGSWVADGTVTESFSYISLNVLASLNATNVIRPHTDGTPSITDNAYSRLVIRRIG